jgi:bisphosphoglycerate-dependent phosphoglycerate mutase
MTKIILTRHGHVEGIKPARFRGRTELPLTELGQAQAKAAAARIAKIWNPAKVYTSPMGRCVATGQEIARASRAFPRGRFAAGPCCPDRQRASPRVGTSRFRNGDRRLYRARQRQSSPALAASRSVPLSVLADRPGAMRDQ